MDDYFEVDEYDRPMQVWREPLPTSCDARLESFGFSARPGKPALPSDEILVVATGHEHLGPIRREHAAVLHGDGVTVSDGGSITTLIDRWRERQLVVEAARPTPAGAESGSLRGFQRGKEIGLCPDVIVPLVPQGRRGSTVLPDWRRTAVWLAMRQLELAIEFWRSHLETGRGRDASVEAETALGIADYRMKRFRRWPPNRAVWSEPRST